MSKTSLKRHYSTCAQRRLSFFLILLCRAPPERRTRFACRERRWPRRAKEFPDSGPGLGQSRFAASDRRTTEPRVRRPKCCISEMLNQKF
jgi:hypothetical protein